MRILSLTLLIIISPLLAEELESFKSNENSGLNKYQRIQQIENYLQKMTSSKDGEVKDFKAMQKELKEIKEKIKKIEKISMPTGQFEQLKKDYDTFKKKDLKELVNKINDIDENIKRIDQTLKSLSLGD